MATFTGFICLSDIPKELIKTGSNGKKYLDIYIGAKRQPSQYGHTHYIKVSLPKEQREAGNDYYIGNIKETAAQNDAQQAHDNGADPLPF